MFEPNNRIIIVDDNKDHLLTLADIFLKTGVGCKTILYDPMYNNPLTGVRVAFFDINITSKSIDLNQVEFDYKSDRDLSAAFNDLAIAIKSCIHKDNGPYALVFWSSNTKLIANFVEFIRDVKKGFSDLPSPILTDSINKDDFSGQDTEKLLEKVKSIFQGKSIELLFDFEQRSNNSSSQIINDLYKIVPKNSMKKDQVWASHVDFEENFDKVFSKIAVSTLGIEYGKQYPDKGITEALLPIHNNLLLKSTASNWKDFLKTIKLKTIKYPKGFDEGTLNAIFHIDKSTGEKDIRGSVVEIDKANKRRLTGFGISNLENWIKKLIPFKEGYDVYQQTIISNSQLVAIELSAACDYTNRKARINQYMLAVVTPVIKDDSINHRIRPESSYHVGGCYFNYDNSTFQIWANLNFVFGSKPNDIRLGSVKFILKKEIMDMVGNKYASHISRIGITSF